MKRFRRKSGRSPALILASLLAAVLLVLSAGCGRAGGGASSGEESSVPQSSASSLPESESSEEESSAPESEESESSVPDENGVYTSKEDVALYLHVYGKLPSNFITKNEARALGWQGGSLESAAPGKCIGGDRFGNYEKSLPEKPGRIYTECDIGTLGAKSRGAERIVFSNDGLIYYTGDHYESFELLYGTP